MCINLSEMMCVDMPATIQGHDQGTVQCVGSVIYVDQSLRDDECRSNSYMYNNIILYLK